MSAASGRAAGKNAAGVTDALRRENEVAPTLSATSARLGPAGGTRYILVNRSAPSKSAGLLEPLMPQHEAPPMFGLFKSAPYADPQFGELIRTKGLWRGSLALPGHPPVPLLLAGDRKAPAPAALAATRQALVSWPDWRAAIEAALYEHYEPYRGSESAEAETPTPDIATPGQVWQHTALQYITVTAMDGGLTVEFGYTVAWDQEHTLGARFQEGRLLELNGSV